ncbi:Transcriptional regulator, BadM/Rrf2 family [Thermobacillus xylanilyticus]|jgi:DNA-binding IscR family transcriptional regulator|uniref:Transcriptional regulator, BadM/Rrf2 family n=1 Tax=Thermobacillus xylanilyticus TaxID=76633 RepID=A0ABM8V1F1_THEXY|nr:Rrf2 family transcriptional regulator [Thermobacillus xylanilyticus]CAG5080802.1 Transcriptional regulator, BadM/Rrf2 family [Thermobacillus xylanilyticus]
MWTAVLDIIHAIEGTASLFHCSLNGHAKCVIQDVMVAAERAMEERLKQQKLADLADKEAAGTP